MGIREARESLRKPRRSRAAVEKENARRGKRSLLKEALPDDPIFTRGFVIGGRYPSRRPRGSGDGKKEKSDG